MSPPRRYRGVWIDEFEGQQFIPEGQPAPEWPSTEAGTPGWGETFERARAATIWLSVDRAGIGHDFKNGPRRMRVEFVGRETLYPGAYGHMGMSDKEIVVDTMVSLEPVAPQGSRAP